MSELLTIIFEADRDPSMQAMLMAEGHRRKSDNHNQKGRGRNPRSALYHLISGSLSPDSPKEGCRETPQEELFPSLFSLSALPRPQQSFTFCLVHVLLRKEEKGLRVADRRKGLNGGPLGSERVETTWSKKASLGGWLNVPSIVHKVMWMLAIHRCPLSSARPGLKHKDLLCLTQSHS